MTAVRWSSCVECMKRVPRWLCTNSAYVCIAVFLMFDAVRRRNITLVYTALVMTALRWSLFAECMEWVSCRVDPGQTVRTSILLKFNTWYWCLMQYKIVISLFKCITMTIAALCGSLSVECMKRCRVVLGRTECTFVLLRMRLNWPVLLMIDAVWSHPYLLSKYITMAMTALPALAFVHWMYETGVMLALDEQRVRLYCCVHGFEGVIAFGRSVKS